MARTRRRRKNPVGTLLVNPRRGKRSKKRHNPSRRSRSRKSVSLAKLFAKVNPSRKRRSGKRRSVRRSRGHRRNPLVVNPSRRRRGGKRRTSARRTRRNPLVVNPRRRRGSKRRAYRRNPLKINRGRRRNPRRIVSMGKGLLGKMQSLVGKIPLIGGVLKLALGGVGGAIGGALGVLPAEMAMPHVGRYFPTWARPYGYTIVGLGLSGLLKAFGKHLPLVGQYAPMLAIGTAAAGGAVDMYRYRHGKSQDLSDGYEYAGDEYAGDDLGDLGDDGSPFAAVEFADADLADADYCGDDVTHEEMAAAELGRAAYRRRFKLRRAPAPEREGGEASPHAGKPGRRWGWLIQWIGFSNFQKLMTYPDGERRRLIQEFKTAAKLHARKLLGQEMDTSVETAQTAGLLVAA